MFSSSSKLRARGSATDIENHPAERAEREREQRAFQSLYRVMKYEQAHGPLSANQRDLVARADEEEEARRSGKEVQWPPFPNARREKEIAKMEEKIRRGEKGFVKGVCDKVKEKKGAIVDKVNEKNEGGKKNGDKERESLIKP